jgi:hypothetical protein
MWGEPLFMDEKQPTFTVTDKRKFTLEGELRDETAQQPEEKAAPSTNVVTMPAPEEREPEAKAAPVPEEPELQQFSAQETAEQNAAYQESSRQIDDMIRRANPGLDAAGAVTFEHVIQSFYVSAMIAMGAGTEAGQKARVDILGARQSIDMLALLQDKTKGNLTQKEEATLQNVLFELRMMFMEITNSIAQSALRPADGKKK